MLSSIVTSYLRKWVVDRDVTKFKSNLFVGKEVRLDKLELKADQLNKHLDLGDNICIKRLWCSSLHVKFSSVINSALSLGSRANSPIAVTVGNIEISIETKESAKGSEGHERKASMKESNAPSPFATESSARMCRNLMRLLQVRIEKVTVRISSSRFRGAALECEAEHIIAVSTPDDFDESKSVDVNEGSTGLLKTASTICCEDDGVPVLKHFKLIRIFSVSIRLALDRHELRRTGSKIRKEEDMLILPVINNGVVSVEMTTKYCPPVEQQQTWSSNGNSRSRTRSIVRNNEAMNSHKTNGLSSKDTNGRRYESGDSKRTPYVKSGWQWQKDIPSTMQLSTQASIVGDPWTWTSEASELVSILFKNAEKTLIEQKRRPQDDERPSSRGKTQCAVAADNIPDAKTAKNAESLLLARSFVFDVNIPFVDISLFVHSSSGARFRLILERIRSQAIWTHLSALRLPGNLEKGKTMTSLKRVLSEWALRLSVERTRLIRFASASEPKEQTNWVDIGRLILLVRSPGYSSTKRGNKVHEKNDREQTPASTQGSMRAQYRRGQIRFILSHVAIALHDRFALDTVPRIVKSEWISSLKKYMKKSGESRQSTVEFLVASMPTLILLIFGNQKQGGWNVQCKSKRLSLTIPVASRKLTSRPIYVCVVVDNVAIRNAVSSTIPRNDTKSVGEDDRDTEWSTTLRSKIVTAILPLTLRTYVRSMRCRVSDGDSAEWPPQLHFRLGSISCGISRRNVHEMFHNDTSRDWIFRIEQHGCFLSSSIAGKAVQTSSGNFEWPINMPPVVVVCGNIAMLSVSGTSEISSPTFSKHMRDAYDTFVDAIKRDKGEHTLSQRSTTESDSSRAKMWTSLVHGMSLALSNIVAVREESGLRKVRRRRQWLYAIMVSAEGVECSSSLPLIQSILRCRTSGALETALHSFSSLRTVDNRQRSQRRVMSENSTSFEDEWTNIQREIDADLSQLSIEDNRPGSLFRPFRRLMQRKGSTNSNASRTSDHKKQYPFRDIASTTSSSSMQTVQSSTVIGQRSSKLKRFGRGLTQVFKKMGKRSKAQKTSTSTNVNQEEWTEGLVCPICRHNFDDISTLQLHFETFHPIDKHVDNESLPSGHDNTRRTEDRHNAHHDGQQRKSFNRPHDDISIPGYDQNEHNNDLADVIVSSPQSVLTHNTDMNSEKEVSAIPEVDETDDYCSENRAKAKSGRDINLEQNWLIAVDKFPLVVSLPMVIALASLGLVDESHSEERNGINELSRSGKIAFCHENQVPFVKLSLGTTSRDDSFPRLCPELLQKTCSSASEIRAIYRLLGEFSVFSKGPGSRLIASVWAQTMRDLVIGCGCQFNDASTFVDADLCADASSVTIQRTKILRVLQILKRRHVASKTSSVVDEDSGSEKTTCGVDPCQDEPKQFEMGEREEEGDCDFDDNIFTDLSPADRSFLDRESVAITIAREQLLKGLISDREFDLIMEKDILFRREVIKENVRKMKARRSRERAGSSSSALPAPFLSQSFQSSRSIGLCATWRAIEDAITYEIQIAYALSGSWRTVGGTSETQFCIQGLNFEYTYVCRIRALFADVGWSPYSSSSNAVKLDRPAAYGTSARRPLSVKLKSIEAMGLLATWSPANDVLQYEVQVKTPRQLSWRTVGGTARSQYLIQGLDRRQSHAFRVRACFTGSGWGPYSPPSSYLSPPS